MRTAYRYIVCVMLCLPACAMAETYQGQDDEQLRQFIGMNPGSYIGVSANYDIVTPDLANGLTRLDDKKKQRKTSWAIQVGSFYAEQSAVEFRYSHYTSYHYLLQSPIAINDFTASLDVFSLDWVLHIPMGSHLYAWGRAGLAGILSNVRVTQNQGATPGVEVVIRDKHIAPEVGAGIAITLGKHLSARIGYHFVYRPTRKEIAQIRSLSGAEVGINYLF